MVSAHPRPGGVTLRSYYCEGSPELGVEARRAFCVRTQSNARQRTHFRRAELLPVPAGSHEIGVPAMRDPGWLERRLPSYMDKVQTGAVLRERRSKAEGVGWPQCATSRYRTLTRADFGFQTRRRCGDLDLLGDRVKVRGKGRKEQIVPWGARNSALRRWLDHREELARSQGQSGGALPDLREAAHRPPASSGRCTSCWRSREGE
jgi:hypothetical protein